MLQIRRFRAMPSIRSADLAPGAVPVHHQHWCHLAPRGSRAPLPAHGSQSWAGQGANTRFMAWQMSQRLQLLSHCHIWLMRSCHPQGSLNTNAKAQGTAQTSVVCKYTNSCIQAHTYRLNDTESTCAVSLPYHKVTLWSVQIKMQNQLALVHIKYRMHSY